jgi:hypothetical protein
VTFVVVFVVVIVFVVLVVVGLCGNEREFVEEGGSADIISNFPSWEYGKDSFNQSRSLCRCCSDLVGFHEAAKDMSNHSINRGRREKINRSLVPLVSPNIDTFGRAVALHFGHLGIVDFFAFIVFCKNIQ